MKALKRIWRVISETQAGGAVNPELAASFAFTLLAAHAEGSMRGIAITSAGLWLAWAIFDFFRGLLELKDKEFQERAERAGLVCIKMPRVRLWDPKRNEWVEHEVQL